MESKDTPEEPQDPSEEAESPADEDEASSSSNSDKQQPEPSSESEAQEEPAETPEEPAKPPEEEAQEEPAETTEEPAPPAEEVVPDEEKEEAPPPTETDEKGDEEQQPPEQEPSEEEVTEAEAAPDESAPEEPSAEPEAPPPPKEKAPSPEPGIEEEEEPDFEKGIFAIKTSIGHEKMVADTLEGRIKRRNADVYSIMLPPNLRGYLLIEALDNREALRDLIKGVQHARTLVEGTTTIEEIEGFLTPKPIVSGIEEGDIVEVIAGPFKGEKAKVKQIDLPKEEITIELFEAMVSIPVTIRGDHVRVLEKESS